MTLRAASFLIAVALPTLLHGQWIGFANLTSTHLSIPAFATDETESDSDTGEGGNAFCLIQGPGSAPCGTPATFTATSPASPTTPFGATFSLLSNTAGASFVGPSSCASGTSCSVVVTTAQSGSVVVRVILNFGGGVLKTCQVTLLVGTGGPPSIQCPPDVTVPCPGPIDPSVTGTPSLSNNCGQATTSFVDTIAGSNCTGSIILRTWTAMNAQGQSATCTQTITRSSVPSITCPAAIAVQCFAHVPPPDIGSVTASDGCGGPVTVTHVGDVASNGASNSFNSITRTYRATNACGIQANCTQTIMVNDTTPPTLTNPGALALQCFSAVPPPSIGSVTATDNCGGTVTLMFVSDAATNGTSSCNNVITRTYQGMDASGNVGFCTQTITLNDTTPPSITCPGPATVQCFSAVPAPNSGSVTATDNCGAAVTVTFVGDLASNGTSSCNNVITRTFTATDACGNMNTCTQTITVNDSAPPTLTCPTALSLQCYSLVPTPSITGVTATDNCGGAVTLTFVSDVASNGTSSCNNVITRTYQGVDACGNLNTCTQTITVNDTTPPSITCPGSATVQCFSAVPTPSIASVTASDNCGGAVTVTFVSDVATSGTSSCNNVITRTYSATDACGNLNTCTQTITVNDTTPPSITCPGPATVQCFSAVPTPSIASVTASDNCGGAVTVTHMGDVATNGTSSCSNVITRTYTATDACGNINACTQTITVNDTTPPSITCTGPTTVQCFSAVPTPNIGSVTASDNCGGAVTVTFVSDVATSGTSSCNNVITRTYSATDACGNLNTCTQTITVNDTTPPSITCPGPATVQCFSAVPSPNVGSVTATDNCGGPVTVTFVSDVATNSTSNCMNVITRTYQGVDACGNVGLCSQVIAVNDTTPPVITCPADFTGACGSPTDPGATGTATATDNCNPAPVISFADVTTGTCATGQTITRTWTASDGCQSVSCPQIITRTPTETGCVFDRGGGCGATTQAVLTADFQQFSITPQITGATPNALVVLAAQLPPYGPVTALAPSCTLLVSPTMPPTLVVGTFQTDAIGSWTSTFNIPAFPKTVQALLQAFVSTPTPGPLGNVTLTRAVEVRRPCPCTVGGSSIGFEFDGPPIAAGRTIWFSSVLKPKRFPDTGAVLRFHSSAITFIASGIPYLLNVPASTIVWDPAATTAETHFDVGTSEWRTTVPAHYDDEVFLSGLGFPVTVDLPGVIDPVTWSGWFSTTVVGADFEWKWAAAVYATFTPDPNAIGVKPVEGGSLSIYANPDHAGTPENFKAFLIPGATGAGRSNYTGFYSRSEKTGCRLITAFFPPE